METRKSVNVVLRLPSPLLQKLNAAVFVHTLPAKTWPIAHARPAKVVVPSRSLILQSLVAALALLPQGTGEDSSLLVSNEDCEQVGCTMNASIYEVYLILKIPFRSSASFFQKVLQDSDVLQMTRQVVEHLLPMGCIERAVFFAEVRAAYIKVIEAETEKISNLVLSP